MTPYTLERLRPEYLDLWQKMEIRPEKVISATTAAQRVIHSKARYQDVEARTGVPWFVVGCVHYRESNFDFNSYLGNGDPLNHPTTNVPKGRGPFATFEDGAVDALITVENLDEIKDWGPEHVAYGFEKVNGFGYRGPTKNIPSPYLWGGTTVQKRGKYISDHVYDASVMDTQLGGMAVLRKVMEIDADARFRSAPVTTTLPVPVPANPTPPLSPRADDTESQVKPLGKSKTIWSSIVQWVTSNTAIVFAFVDKHPEIVIGFVGVSSILLYLVISGRVDAQKVIKHLTLDDTVKT